MFNELLKNIRKNKLVKVASINSLSVFVRLISGFAISKFMAIYIGPSGMAISGNLSNFLQSIQSLSSLGVKNGIIKYVSECKEDKSQFKNVVSSGFIISICIGFLLSVVLFLFANSFSFLVFDSISYSFLFRVSALIMPFFTVHVFFIAVISGLKKVTDLVIINIVAYLSSAILIISLMNINQLEGALLAIVITPILLFCSLFFKYKLLKEIIQNISLFPVYRNFFKKITSFFSMTLFSGIMFPFLFLLIRSYIIDNVGTEEAGYWEAMRKISGYYMMFVYTLFEIYLLPLLSENKSRMGFKTIVFGFYKSLLPFVFIGFLVIFILKFTIVKLILTDEFLPMNELFIWQLVGDFFRIIFLTISYQFLAKKLIKYYITCEIVYMALLYFFSRFFIDYFGVLGAVKAHAISSFLYMLLLFFVFRKEFFGKDEELV
ncbi:O-antigen translocase [Algibacter sp. R77976]|uniref:O-antigen translocase n=1 Tax=Algibacter sp. R77976 TaxID=3093873 RepID=UPI0037C94651